MFPQKAQIHHAVALFDNLPVRSERWFAKGCLAANQIHGLCILLNRLTEKL